MRRGAGLVARSLQNGVTVSHRFRMSSFSDPQFDSYFLGGFECSTHRRRDGRRLDLLETTAHDVHAAADYEQLAGFGIRTVREGFRWHRIEQRAGHYDFSSVRPLVTAARETGTQVLWDLLHFGWPDDVDPF